MYLPHVFIGIMPPKDVRNTSSLAAAPLSDFLLRDGNLQ